MSTENFQEVYEAVSTRADGWLTTLKNAWFGGCLTEDQKSLLEAAL